jgi:cytochrome c oxidase assembly factor CtaG
MATLTFTQSLHYLQQNRFFFVSYLVIIVCIRIVMVNVATAYSNGRQGGQHLRSSLLQVPVLCLIIVKKSRLLNALFHNYYCCKWLVCPAVIGIISNVYCICVNYDTIFVTL